MSRMLVCRIVTPHGIDFYLRHAEFWSPRLERSWTVGFQYVYALRNGWVIERVSSRIQISVTKLLSMRVNSYHAGLSANRYITNLRLKSHGGDISPDNQAHAS